MKPRTISSILLALAACGGDVTVATQDAGTGGAGGEDASPPAATSNTTSAGGGSMSSSAGGMGAGAGGQGTDCGIPPPTGLFECCNGMPCRGYCHDTSGCVCNDLKGGCLAPTTCCFSVCKEESSCGF